MVRCYPKTLGKSEAYHINIMQESILTTKKMQKETEQQYTAWTLYCEYGSIDKLHQAWQGLGWRTKADERRTEFEALIEKLGKPPVRTTIGEWAKKFRWVERRELKLAEDLEALREKTKKIIVYKKHKIAETFERIINKRLKQLREGEAVTTLDLKQVWEMFQVELGKPTSRGELKLEQHSLNPEEKIRGKKIYAALEKILDEESGQ